jgi:hypothetical protein
MRAGKHALGTQAAERLVAAVDALEVIQDVAVPGALVGFGHSLAVLIGSAGGAASGLSGSST